VALAMRLKKNSNIGFSREIRRGITRQAVNFSIMFLANKSQDR